MRSRLNRASFSISCWSWTRGGPPGQAEALYWLSATGAPDSVVKIGRLVKTHLQGEPEGTFPAQGVVKETGTTLEEAPQPGDGRSAKTTRSSKPDREPPSHP